MRYATQALRAETAASTEALEAERAAKFAADAEATELRRSMDDLNAALRRERCVLAEVKTDLKAGSARICCTRAESAMRFSKCASCLYPLMCRRCTWSTCCIHITPGSMT